MKKLLNRFENLPVGQLTILTPENEVLYFKGTQNGPLCDLQIKDWKALDLLLKRGDLGLGEAYCQGFWETSDLITFFNYCSLNLQYIHNQGNANFLHKLFLYFYHTVVRMNSRKGSRSNIREHYDIGNDFYSLWLDPSMTYSSALRKTETDSLLQAQMNKYQRILDLCPVSGADVLEIGCGWGGFAEQAALQGANITGITVSDNQYTFSKQRLKDKAQILLQDYRDTNKVYDFIVSIEMFEAVGEKYWPVYFKKIKSSLVKGGKALIQTITIRDDLFKGHRYGASFIRHYIFPGGILPTKDRFCNEARKAGLEVASVLEFGQDYAWTLRTWLKNLQQIEPLLTAKGHSPSFLKAWNLYLTMCIAAFESKNTNVMQVELIS